MIFEVIFRLLLLPIAKFNDVHIYPGSSLLFTLDSNMADDEMNLVLQDLQKQLQNAKIPVGNLSTIAKKGDDAVGIHHISPMGVVK